MLTPEAKQPFELKASSIQLEGASAPDYPLQKKRHSVEYLRTVAHLRPRTNLFSAVFRIRSVAAFAIHSFFQERGFVYVNTPFMILPGFGERVLPEAAPARETGELRHVTEEMEVEQGNLVICFRYRRTGPADYPALSVFNEIFGGGPASRLFLNVREKRSLCYSVGSGVDRFKEAMLVAAGIDFDRQEETEEAVFAELKRLAEGDIPEEELEAARRSVATGYLRGLDSPSAICNFRLGQSLLGAGGDLRQYAALSAEVRAEDVAAIAAAMAPGLVYFLRKGAAQ